MKKNNANALRGLVIRKEPLDDILAGKKTWEIRGSGTTIRGTIALIQKVRELSSADVTWSVFAGR